MKVEIDNISFSFGKRDVLDKICFNLDRRGVTALWGLTDQKNHTPEMFKPYS